MFKKHLYRYDITQGPSFNDLENFGRHKLFTFSGTLHGLGLIIPRKKHPLWIKISELNVLPGQKVRIEGHADRVGNVSGHYDPALQTGEIIVTT